MKTGAPGSPKPPSPETIRDSKFSKTNSGFWGDIVKASDSEYRKLTPNQQQELAEHQKKLEDFVHNISKIYDDLASPRKVGYLHQFKDKEDWERIAQGLPMLVESLNDAVDYEQSSQFKQEQMQRDPELIKKHEKERLVRERSRYMFMEVGAKLFPEIRKPQSVKDAIFSLKLFSARKSDNFAGAAQLAIDKLGTNTISFKEAGDYLEQNALIAVDFSIDYKTDESFGSVDSERVLQDAKNFYYLYLIAQFLKETLGTPTALGKSPNEPEKEQLKEKKREIPEKSDDLGQKTVKMEKIDLGSEVFAPLYALVKKSVTLAEVQSTVTLEMKRLLLEKCLQDVDKIIENCKDYRRKNPGDSAILNFKIVSQFGGARMAIAEAAVFQCISSVAKKRIVSIDEVARRTMVDFLKNDLGYDLSKDSIRGPLLRSYTTAFM